MGDTYIVAEIGTAHGGDVDRAADLITAAAESGADCAKFQYVIAHEIVHPNSGLVDLPGGPVPIYDRFKSLERAPAFYLELRALCDRREIDFLCTPFGIESMHALLRIGVSRLKIASPEINHTALLRTARESGVPTIVSTGVSRLSDIEYAVCALKPVPVTLLHCVTAYPAPETDYNLRLIPSLTRIFGVPVGLSDHSLDPALVPGLAVALGAPIVEKHFTLDRSAGGMDDPIAMDPAMFTQMAATIRRIDAILSLDPAGGREKVLGEFAAEYGSERVRSVLGDGVKRLAASEESNYATTRRSIVAVRDRSTGTVVGTEDVAVLRPEKNLSPGIEPRYLDDVIGALLSEPISAGAGVQWSHLIRTG
ncbi:MAG: N-acetylneuraminate synthase family protein [Spirochaetia bacterium]